MRMRKLEHCASCLPQSSIMGYSLCCNKASTELQYKLRFPGKGKYHMLRLRNGDMILIVSLRLSRG